MASRKHENKVTQAVANLGKPFVKARAEWARAQATNADPARIEALKAEVLRQLYASKELDAAVQSHIDKAMAEDGPAVEIDFKVPVRREKKSPLRAVAESKGISQSELARKAKMDPAMLNRVFKNPDNSKLSTLRRIAKALDVSIQQVV